MRKLEIYRNKIFAGTLTEYSRVSYVFRYDDTYYHDPLMRAISLTIPKNQQEYRSDFLFPFFFNMLSEGANKKLQCRWLKIDEDDHFKLLAETAQYETIGPVTVKPVEFRL